jgi:hypothetical protein
MPNRNKAITLCRVSSYEQLKNGSLGTQEDNVLKAARELNVTIPEDGVWAGEVSSKKGVNFNRKDLLQMYDYCSKHRSVKYLIVQEVDRFMRSPDEQTYWWVRFKYGLDVLVWFADKPELNEDTHIASLRRFLEGWQAGGSNEERMRKSINGQVASLQHGKWPFPAPAGYIRGRRTAIPDIDQVRGPALKEVLLDIVSKRLTPTQALIKLNGSDFVAGGRAHYKMDKFRDIVTNSFYAGVVEMDEQVKFRNTDGKHDPLITLDQHEELVRIMESKKKTQQGPRKGGNPKYPLSNLVTCANCLGKSNGRYVGYDHGNGSKNGIVYEKYRCRACARYLKRQELHQIVSELVNGYVLTDESIGYLLKSLNEVWAQEEKQTQQDILRTEHKIKDLTISVEQKVASAVDPANLAIKGDLLALIANEKQQLNELREDLEQLKSHAGDDKEQFIKFALEFVDNLGERLLDPGLTREYRYQCKQLLFPDGFYLDADNKVYTTEISPIYRLAANKKGTEVPEMSTMVRVKRL